MGFFEIIAQYYQYFLRGTQTTIVVALFTVFFGAILGCAIALMRLSHVKPLQWFSKLYITIIRGTPMLVQLWTSSPIRRARCSAWICSGPSPA